jgi:peptidoglycan/xylan/chitin deacetylase (PgdA/CDA1 family)
MDRGEPMLRGLLKTGIACGMRWSGADLAWRTLHGKAPWIVAYHRVVEDFERSAGRSMAAMLIGRPMLESHLDWIGRRFRPATLDEVGARLENGALRGKPLAAVTFDDGYRDVYHHALPLLRRKGIPAAVFMVTGLAGTRRPPLHDRLFLQLKEACRALVAPRQELLGLLRGLGIEPPAAARREAEPPDPHRLMRALLEALPAADLERIAAALVERVRVDPDTWEEHLPLTWEMVEEMRRAGITIGSHSRLHTLLTNEDSRSVAEELEGSRRDLQAGLGIPVRHFAYPNGWFDGRTVRAVERAGYRYAYTACRHRDPDHPLLTIPRTLLWERSALGARGRFSPALMGWRAPGPCRPAGGCGPDHALRPGRDR